MNNDEKFVKDMLKRAEEKHEAKPMSLAQDVDQKKVEDITRNIREIIQKSKKPL